MFEDFVLLLAPFAPHIAEELWAKLGHDKTLMYETWPTFAEKYLVEDEVEIAVMIQGKVRAKLTIAKDMDEASLKDLALNDERIADRIKESPVKKIIVVPNRMVNIVI